jgi:dTDP-4-dehydrorhamnose reductase
MIALATAQILAQGVRAASAQGTHAGSAQGTHAAPAQRLVAGAGDLFEFVQERSGVYHLSAAGSCSWYDFTREILRTDPRASEHKCKTVTRITSADYPTPAKRPANSVLSNQKCFETFGLQLPDWQKQLALVQGRLQ